MSDRLASITIAPRPKPATAETSDRPAELYGIQMLRGLAAATVVAHHVAEIASQDGSLRLPNWLVTAGASGVDVFFVISGCIMVHSAFREGRASVKPGRFLGRRLLRVYPIYWVCALALLALLSMRHGPTPSGLAVVPSLLLLPSTGPIIPYSWTLSYELYFYLAFAIALFCRSLRSTIAITIALMITTSAIGNTFVSGAIHAFLVDPIAAEFAFGMILTLLYRRRHGSAGRWPFHPLLILPAYAAIAAAPAFIEHIGTVGLPGWPRVAAWGLPSVLIVAASLSIGEPRNRSARIAAVLGNASYAIYLSHFIVMVGYRFLLARILLSSVPSAALMGAMFIFASGVGLLVHFYVEVPLMTFSRRLGSRELAVWRKARS